jgi:glucan-binding YG repeat protein
MNTSELLYLMQQYDKYLGYITKADVEKDEWGDLLVSILENVSESDFTKATDYKSFSRKAEDAISSYEAAETSSMIKAAEEAMYKLITDTQSKTAGASEEKATLKSDIYSLYFNAKSTVNSSDYGYVTDYATFDNAVLTNYAYIAAVTKSKGDVATVNSSVLLSGSKTSVGYFTLYPAADYYKAYNYSEAYAGNTSTTYGDAVTDEYEWFQNVYELANRINSTSKTLAGIVSAVDSALNDAVAALEVTKTATTSASTKLDEAIADAEDDLDFYVTGNGVNEDDFNATYYAAYQSALAYAAEAEGAAQVANATAMVKVAAAALGYQGAQTTVTKSDITGLKAAIADAQTALTSIKESADYSAAQVTALNKAIAQAQDIVDIYNGKVSGYNKVNTASAAYVGDKDGIVKSDITGAEAAIDAAINYSEVIMGWSKNADGAWQYGEADGYVQSGWKQINSVWYYFENGVALQSTWKQIDGKWYYLNSNCGAAYGWAKVDGSWYYFGGDNAMKTGWVKVDGSWYYLNAGGKMVTGWAEVNGTWYYFSKESNALGQMLANTTTPDGYTVDANGALVD